MSTAVALQQTNMDILEKLIVDGDLSKLSQEERLRYYHLTCERLSLDPMSQPLSYLKLSGKLVLYAGKGATDQIARKAGVSRRLVKTDILAGKVYLVVAEATDASGRVEQSTGATSIEGLAGDALVNAMLKAESKAKRRAILSFTGAGMLDETEVETIPGAQVMTPEQVARSTGRLHTVNTSTDEIVDPPADEETMKALRAGIAALESVGFPAKMPVPHPTQRHAEGILRNWRAEYKRRSDELDAATAPEPDAALEESPL